MSFSKMQLTNKIGLCTSLLSKKVAQRLTNITKMAQLDNNKNSANLNRTSFSPIFKVLSKYKKLENEKNELIEILEKEKKDDIIKMFKDEILYLETKIDHLFNQFLEDLESSNHRNNDKDAILEVTAGVGGTEAALFSREIFDMYLNIANIKDWEVKILVENGGKRLKRGLAIFKGENAFKSLENECGCHRVQRVPFTERKGKIQTSIAKVTVFPNNNEETNVNINQSDVIIDYYRSSGPGGQNVNKLETAVRLTHIPTGIVVTCEEERTQHVNKKKAFEKLKNKILMKKILEGRKELSEKYNSLKISGERSDKIRTYSWTRRHVVDHRTKLKILNLDSVLKGDALTRFWEALEIQKKEELVANLTYSNLVDKKIKFF